MPNKKKNILLVDDDEMQLSFAKNMLHDTYEVFTAKSGKEALDYLYHGLAPNLILLDILMPNMDGWETFNRIQAISLLQNVPIVFLTSINGLTEEKRALEMGAADYIVKPYSKADLINRLKNVIADHEAKNMKL